MKKLNKISMGLAAVALTIGAAYAVSTISTPQKAPEARETKTVSATWTLGQEKFDGPADQVSDASVITATNLSFTGTSGDGVTNALVSSRTQTAKPSSGDITFTAWKVAVSADKQKIDGNYVSFGLTSAQEFTPTNLSLQIATFNNGGARYDVEVVAGEKAYTIATGVTPERSNRQSPDDDDKNFTVSYPIQNIPAVKGDFEVRFYLWSNDGREREVGFRDVCISGTYSEGEGGEIDPEPSDDYFFHIPGTLAVPATKEEVNYGWEGAIRVEEKNTGVWSYGYTYANTSVTYKNVHVHEAGIYKAVLPLDYAINNGAKVLVEVTDVETGNLEASGELVSPRNNTPWEEIDCPLAGVINEGLKNIKFSFTPGADRDYAFNMRAPQFVRTGDGKPVNPGEIPAGANLMPGDIDISTTHWEYKGSDPRFGIEDKNGVQSVACIKDGDVATGNIYVTEEGKYSISMDIPWFNSNNNPVAFDVVIYDTATNRLEGTATINATGTAAGLTAAFDNVLTFGKKEIQIKATDVNDAGGFLANYNNVKTVLTAKIPAFALAGGATELVLKARPDAWYDFAENTAVDMEKEVIEILHAAEFGNVNEDHYGNVKISIAPADEETAKSLETADKQGNLLNKPASVGTFSAKGEGISNLEIIAHTAGRYILTITNDEIQANGATLLAKTVEIPVIVKPTVEGVGLTFNFIRHSYDGFNQDTNNGYSEGMTPAVVYDVNADPVWAGDKKDWNYKECLLYTDYADGENVEIYWKYNQQPAASEENPVALRSAEAKADSDVTSGYTKFDIADAATAPNLETARNNGGLSFVIKQNGVYSDPETMSVYASTDENPNKPTAVEQIEAVEGDEILEYYNLQGIRVDENARGILIEVKRIGNKVESRRILK